MATGQTLKERVEKSTDAWFGPAKEKEVSFDFLK
jgi:hypothetical protein